METNPEVGPSDEHDATDFADCLRYHSDTDSYSISLRWKPLSQLEMVGIALQLSQHSVVIDTLDLGQTNFGIHFMFIHIIMSFVNQIRRVLLVSPTYYERIATSSTLIWVITTLALKVHVVLQNV